ncbi:zinc finger, CCHC-type containing protein [Tanacetum coccineum]|uniref:Zinc finger, CCHC-type containing protein n=1 Tax=Tanacetum coccineum TaxID=301880 RepID=A0ABQ5CVG5_9ASTR
MAVDDTVIPPSTLSLSSMEKAFGVTNIKTHVPLILDLDQLNYDAWSELFKTHCYSFGVLGFLDGTTVNTSNDPNDWKKLDSLVKDARALELQEELCSLDLGNLTIAEYFKKIKATADLFSNIDAAVDEKTPVMVVYGYGRHISSLRGSRIFRPDSLYSDVIAPETSIRSTHPPPPHLLLLSTSQSTWHRRLGHPGDDVLRSLALNKFISCNKTKSMTLCNACQLDGLPRRKNSVFRSFFENTENSLDPTSIDCQSFEDLAAHAAWVKGQKEVAVLMLLTMDLESAKSSSSGAYDIAPGTKSACFQTSWNRRTSADYERFRTLASMRKVNMLAPTTPSITNGCKLGMRRELFRVSHRVDEKRRRLPQGAQRFRVSGEVGSLKTGALSLCERRCVIVQVEAIRSIILELPSGLVIVLNNCHYAPSITRGVISVSHLFDDGFVNRFDDNNVILVSKDNLVYFMAVPWDGIFEIDTSLNHEEDDQEIDEPQSDINPIRRSTRTRRPTDRLCLYIDTEEHELGDLGEPANYRAALLDPESKKWLDAMNVESIMTRQ